MNPMPGRFCSTMLAAAVGGVMAWAAPPVARAADPSRPNVVLILADDQGYGDLASFGAKDIPTPNIDSLARDGTRFTDFYVPQAVCSASRAALLTGCYPNRIGITGALFPHSKIGLSDSETTLPQILRERGYATGMLGKWHLGDSPRFLPTRHGFQSWFGLPYSNDMWPGNGARFPDLPLYENEKVVQYNPDQSQLTTWYAKRAVRFIDEHKDGPFFLYIAHAMPHVPLHASSKFKGKSGRGLYGDVIMEIDWSVGQVLSALHRNGLEDNTLVIYASDNGPWLVYGNHGGSAGGLREGKMTEFEGGVREPCLMRFPGKIPAGRVCHEMVLSMDILPTVAKLAGGTVPTDRIIDGRDVWPILSGQPGAKTPHEAFYYYWGNGLDAVRSGPWKLHAPHDYPTPNPPGKDGKPGKTVTRHIAEALYNLEADPAETKDVASANPEVVKRLEELMENAREDLGDGLTKRKGKNVREAGRLGPKGP